MQVFHCEVGVLSFEAILGSAPPLEMSRLVPAGDAGDDGAEEIPTMRKRSLLMLAVAPLIPTLETAVGGTVLYEQAPAPNALLLQAASQEFPDAPEFTIFAADDFTVGDAAGWNVESLHSFFTTGNGSGLPPEGIRWIIWGDNGAGQPGNELLNVVSDGFDLMTGLADIDLSSSGDAFELPPGDYWFASQIIGGISSFGQEFHRGSLDGAGTADFLWNNPGGGFGLPPGWVDAHGAGLSDVTNLAFQIGGSIIPEPATLCLLGMGTLSLFRRRIRTFSST